MGEHWDGAAEQAGSVEFSTSVPKSHIKVKWINSHYMDPSTAREFA